MERLTATAAGQHGGISPAPAARLSRGGGFLFLFYSFQPAAARRFAADDERHGLHDERGCVQPVPAHLGAGNAPDGILRVEHQLVKEGKLRLGRHGLVQENEFKRAYVRLAVDRVFPLLRRQLAALDKIAHDLPEVHVHALVALEPEIEPDAEDVVRAVGLDAVAPRVRLVGDVHADEPVRRSPLGVLVEDGVENVAVDGIHVPGLIEKDEVVRERRCRNTTPCSAWRMWPTAVRSTMTR